MTLIHCQYDWHPGMATNCNGRYLMPNHNFSLASLIVKLTKRITEISLQENYNTADNCQSSNQAASYVWFK
jgi:hypothetical protein